MSIRKIVIELVVIYDDSLTTIPSTLDLEQITYEINEGDCVGQARLISDAAIAEDALRDELLAVGNDGEFFGEPNITTTEHLIRMIESMFTTTEDEKGCIGEFKQNKSFYRP